MEELTMFDLLGAEEFKPIKSTDWKWWMSKDYPEKNGLTVFSLFACGGGVQWVTNSRDVMWSEIAR